jgi:hypothetical protein
MWWEIVGRINAVESVRASNAKRYRIALFAGSQSAGPRRD